MCGLAGLVAQGGGGTSNSLAARAQAMAATLSHRGPDDAGVWSDEAAGVGLAFRRLSIIDRSTAGHQPMESADGRMVLVFNGEVYNFADIRVELEGLGHRFRGHSDSEVVVEACAEWGVEAAVGRFIGMFALALWDCRAHALTLVRDRLGVKPLYWGLLGGTLAFASELKALRAYPGWTPELDRGSAAAFFRFSYCPAPHTIYRGVRKLRPGHLLRFEPGMAEPRETAYWDLASVVAEGVRERDRVSEAEAEEELMALLDDAVGRRLVADVPLGAFLSGGIDSSLVVAAMQRIAGAPVKTFTIGFAEDSHDEAGYAREVARYLGTDHTERLLEPGEAIDSVPRLAEWYDEPFADSSQIPTALVSAVARKSVTVVLTGDGGDELFGGYDRYFAGERLWRWAGVPAPLRRLAAGAIRGLAPETWTAVLSMLPPRHRPKRGGHALYWLADSLDLGNRDEVCAHLVSLWSDADGLVPGARAHRGAFWTETPEPARSTFVDQMQYLDAVTYLPDDILTKVDRASMAFGLEARGPLLDHRVAALAWRLPRALKYRDGGGKWLLKKLLAKSLPRHLFERPKQGFSVPIGDWLRGPLRDWAEDLLSESRLKAGGVVDPLPVRKAWRAHLDGRAGLEAHIWTVLMFESWRERWMGSQ